MLLSPAIRLLLTDEPEQGGTAAGHSLAASLRSYARCKSGGRNPSGAGACGASAEDNQLETVVALNFPLPPPPLLFTSPVSLNSMTRQAAINSAPDPLQTVLDPGRRIQFQSTQLPPSAPASSRSVFVDQNNPPQRRSLSDRASGFSTARPSLSGTGTRDDRQRASWPEITRALLGLSFVCAGQSTSPMIGLPRSALPGYQVFSPPVQPMAHPHARLTASISIKLPRTRSCSECYPLPPAPLSPPPMSTLTTLTVPTARRPALCPNLPTDDR